MDIQHLLLLALALAALGFALAWWLAAGRGSRRSRRRTRRALNAETEAEHLLQELGYEVVERQVGRAWSFLVDGEPVEAAVRADLLVQRDGALYVAEVKTGTRAPDPSFPATRRQLLEYLMVFEPDGLLLVDMEQRNVMEVEFPVGFS